MKQHHSKQSDNFSEALFFARVLILNLLCVRFGSSIISHCQTIKKGLRQTKTASLGAKFTIVCLPPIYWRQADFMDFMGSLQYNSFRTTLDCIGFLAEQKSEKDPQWGSPPSHPPSHPLRQIWTFIAN